MGFFTGISNKFISGQYRIILSADTASEVRQLLSQSSKPKQGQRSQSARGFCPRSTMRVPQPDIIEHFGNADAVPQLPERCLSRKAGIVRCCPDIFEIVCQCHDSRSSVTASNSIPL